MFSKKPSGSQMESKEASEKNDFMARFHKKGKRGSKKHGKRMSKRA